jgi:hypothetical protein
MEIKIVRWDNQKIIVCGEYESLKDCLEKNINVDFAYASLASANLDGASLASANLDGARLDDASLAGANLVGASLDDASLAGANLDGASLAYASLHDASLAGANLDGASLDDASLVGASLVGANLDGASLAGANLVGASLAGARLAGANLHGASLIDAMGNIIKIIGERPLLIVGPIGSRSDYLHAFITDGGIYIKTGCFFGTIVQFIEAVTQTHKDNCHAQEYRAALALIEAHAAIWTPKEKQ